VADSFEGADDVTYFIAAIFGWLRRLLTPPKSAGKHARQGDRTIRPRPARPVQPKPQTRPPGAWTDFTPPVPTSLAPPAPVPWSTELPADDGPQDAERLVPWYMLTADEQAA
jgi:hypothetical protein